MSEYFISILMGSDSDLPVLEHCFQVLKSYGVTFEAHILSAHRTPDWVVDYIRQAEKKGCGVFIAAAGMAAHLAGAVAAQTIRPVIGVPMQVGALEGMDALLSTVQMPGGMPVACMGIGKAGAINAAHLAVQILALRDASLQQAIHSIREQKRSAIKAADAKLQQSLVTVEES